MGNKVLMLAFVWAALCAGNPLMAQTKTKKKSATALCLPMCEIRTGTGAKESRKSRLAVAC